MKLRQSDAALVRIIEAHEQPEKCALPRTRASCDENSLTRGDLRGDATQNWSVIYPGDLDVRSNRRAASWGGGSGSAGAEVAAR